MKKFFLFFLFALLSAAQAFAYDYDFEADGFYYKIKDGYAEVTRGENVYRGSITIPATVTNNGATYTVTSIGKSAMQGDNTLYSVTLPSTIKRIEGSAFCYQSRISSINLPEGLEYIGESAFWSLGLNADPTIVIPSTVTFIGETAFGDGDLTFSVAEGNSVYDSRENCNALIETSTNTMVRGFAKSFIPSSVKHIASKAFQYSEITSITIPKSVVTIGDRAFHGCIYLQSAVIEAKSVGANVFYNCIRLENIELRDGVENIETNAFGVGVKLNSLFIPKTVTHIGFNQYCYNIENINVAEENPIYDSRNNCNAIIETATNTLIWGSKNGTIPQDVKAIGAYAFSGCDVSTIPEGVESIESYAFYSCSSTEISIPSSVKSIGSHAFYGCSNLEKITFSEGLETIDEYAFYYCEKLESVKLPSTLKSIAGGAFLHCYNLKKAIMLSFPQFKSNTYYVAFPTESDFTIYVPADLLNQFQNNGTWRRHNLVELDTDLATLDNVIYIDPVEAYRDSEATLSVKMKNTAEITGYQFDLYLDEGFTFATDEEGLEKAELSLERTTAKRTNFFNTVLQEDGSLRVLCYSSKKLAFEGNDGEVARIAINIPADIVCGNFHGIRIRNIQLGTADGTAYDTEYVKAALTVADVLAGDANIDGKVGVADLTSIAAHILGRTPAGFSTKAADANQDGKVAVADLTLISSWILDAEADSRRRVAPAFSTEGLSISLPDFSIMPGETVIVPVMVNNPTAVFAGYQFDVVLPAGLSIIDATLSTDRTNARRTDYFSSATMAGGVTRVLCYSSSNTTFDGTEGAVALLTIEADKQMQNGTYTAEIANADLALRGTSFTPATAAASISVGGLTTAIDTIASEAQRTNIYDLSGRRITGSKPGLYISNGHKVIK